MSASTSLVSLNKQQHVNAKILEGSACSIDDWRSATQPYMCCTDLYITGIGITFIREIGPGFRPRGSSCNRYIRTRIGSSLFSFFFFLQPSLVHPHPPFLS